MSTKHLLHRDMHTNSTDVSQFTTVPGWIEFAIDRFIVRSTYSKMEFIHACFARLHKARSLSFVPFSSSLSSTSILAHSIVCVCILPILNLFFYGDDRIKKIFIWSEILISSKVILQKLDRNQSWNSLKNFKCMCIMS